MSQTDLTADKLHKAVSFNSKKKKKDGKKLLCETITPNDSKDPSYTNLTLPYRVVCRIRYQQAGIRQKRQFLREIAKQEMTQSKALSGVRIYREFMNPVLVPVKAEDIIQLTRKQQFKLEELLQ